MSSTASQRNPSAPATLAEERLILAGVAALTAIAFTLRVVGMSQSMFGDELFLYAVISHGGLGGILDQVVATESTPPLHFILAWLGSQIGDPTISFRLPSLVLGTATIPLTYVLGSMTVGRRAALVGSALVALDPFTIFYSTEGRAYATLAFITIFSTIALLRALETGERAWWIAFAVASCAALWTHYQAVFVIAAQGGWAAWYRRDHLRELLFAYGAIVLGYAAWLPSFIVQSQDSAANRGEALSPLTLESCLRDLLVVLCGHPFIALREIPGRPAIVAMGVALTAAAVGLIASGRWGRVRPELALLGLLALVTPVGGLLYSLGPGNVYVPRGMIPSLAPAMLLIGALLVAGRRPLALGATAVVIAALSVGAVKTALDPDFRRPPLRDAAALVDRTAGPRDQVLDASLFPLFSPRQLRDGLEAHLERPHGVVKADLGGPQVWRSAQPGTKVVSVGPAVPGAKPGPPARLRPRFSLVDRRVWSGWIPIYAYTYRVTGR